MQSDSATPDTELNARIAAWYDGFSAAWENAFGEHFHHGFYGSDQKKSLYQAQNDMVTELLRFGNVTSAQKILDLGCGIGGASLDLLTRLNARYVTGLTISEGQANRARERAAELRFSSQSRFDVGDACAPPYVPQQFDLVWAMESAEHMPDKVRFLQSCAQMLAPGGTLLLSFWCSRTMPPPLEPREERRLQKLYASLHATLVPLEDYADAAQQAGLQGIQTADWSDEVAPFWQDAAKTVLRGGHLKPFIQVGDELWDSVYGMYHLMRGHRNGLVRYGVLVAHKPL